MDAAGRGIGRVIRAARERAGLSQEGLAEFATMNRNYLGEIERGEASPTIAVIEKIARALGMRISDLLREYEEHDGL